ncbi:RraA family protein [Thermoanaerobacteraceae bacterium SP2]|nr:RraA family protein [Thermoanaerobacteraceae bacterium SP2]
MGVLTKELRERLNKVSTTNVSDALDALGLKGSTYGIKRMYEGCKKIIGEAVTIKLVAAGLTKSTTHIGVNAIELAKEGDVIVIDNGGRIDVNCWGGVLSTGAKYKGVSGVVIDGACRDLDDCIELDFPVYARSTICATARGRVMEEATNVIISCHGVQVRPGDVVMGDINGVVFIPQERLEDVIAKAEELQAKEIAMCNDIKSGMSMKEVDKKYNYENMLK